MRKLITRYLPFILIIILGFTVYGNSLNGKFIWDDEFLVKDNIYIKNWSKLPRLFVEDIGAGAKSKLFFYRPIQMLTYVVDYSIWKLNVFGYHLTNTLLHILVALAVYWLISLLFKDKLLSLLTGLLFVSYPIHTEAVSYISGRADSLAALFMLLCFILYIKQSNLILISLCYILALLSKENALILPLLVLLDRYAFKRKVLIKKFLVILGITVIYILLRVTILKSLLPQISSTTSLVQRLPGYFVAITDYLRLLFLPFGLHMEYGNKLFSFTHPKAIIGLIIVILLIIYVFKQRNKNTIVSFSLCWFLIALFPQSNIYPITAYMAEHWLYLPSLGLFLIAARVLSVLYGNKRVKAFAIVLIIGLLSYYSYLTMRQNYYWKEPIAFYEKTLKYAPDSQKLLYNLGNVYKDLGRYGEAIVLYNKAIRLNPNFLDAYNNLGTIYEVIGKYDEAIILHKKVIVLNPNYAKAYNNLGNVYRDIGDYDEAISLYKRAIEINPSYAGAYSNLGAIYGKIGRYEEAISSCKKAVELDSNFAIGYRTLAAIYYQMKQYDLAIKYYDKSIELGLKADPKFSKLLEPFR